MKTFDFLHALVESGSTQPAEGGEKTRADGGAFNALLAQAVEGEQAKALAGEEKPLGKEPALPLRGAAGEGGEASEGTAHAVAELPEQEFSASGRKDAPIVRKDAPITLPGRMMAIHDRIARGAPQELSATAPVELAATPAATNEGARTEALGSEVAASRELEAEESERDPALLQVALGNVASAIARIVAPAPSAPELESPSARDFQPSELAPANDTQVWSGATAEHAYESPQPARQARAEAPTGSAAFELPSSPAEAAQGPERVPVGVGASVAPALDQGPFAQAFQAAASGRDLRVQVPSGRAVAVDAQQSALDVPQMATSTPEQTPVLGVEPPAPERAASSDARGPHAGPRTAATGSSANAVHHHGAAATSRTQPTLEELGMVAVDTPQRAPAPSASVRSERSDPKAEEKPRLTPQAQPGAAGPATTSTAKSRPLPERAREVTAAAAGVPSALPSRTPAAAAAVASGAASTDPRVQSQASDAGTSEPTARVDKGVLPGVLSAAPQVEVVYAEEPSGPTAVPSITREQPGASGLERATAPRQPLLDPSRRATYVAAPSAAGGAAPLSAPRGEAGKAALYTRSGLTMSRSELAPSSADAARTNAAGRPAEPTRPTVLGEAALAPAAPLAQPQAAPLASAPNSRAQPAPVVANPVNAAWSAQPQPQTSAVAEPPAATNDAARNAVSAPTRGAAVPSREPSGPLAHKAASTPTQSASPAPPSELAISAELSANTPEQKPSTNTSSAPRSAVDAPTQAPSRGPAQGQPQGSLPRAATRVAGARTEAATQTQAAAAQPSQAVTPQPSQAVTLQPSQAKPTARANKPADVTVAATPAQPPAVTAQPTAREVVDTRLAQASEQHEAGEGARAQKRAASHGMARVDGYSRNSFGQALAAYGGRGHQGADHGASRERRSDDLGDERDGELERASAEGLYAQTFEPLPQAQPLLAQTRDAQPTSAQLAQPAPQVSTPVEVPDVEFAARPPINNPEAASISLHHPDLGPIQLQVQRDHGRVEVHAVIETAHAEAVLRANESGIRQGVQQSGLNFGALRLRVRGEEPQANRTTPARKRRVTTNQREA